MGPSQLLFPLALKFPCMNSVTCRTVPEILKAHRCNAAAIAQTQCSVQIWNSVDDTLLLCFASDLRRPDEAAFTELNAHFGEQRVMLGLQMSNFMYNFPNQFSLDK